MSVGSGIYHMQNVCRVDMPVDLAVFDRAWSLVVQRHPILRSAFVMNEELGALQIVLKNTGFACQHLDFRALSPDEQARELDELLRAERRRGFDLSQPKSFRVHWIRTGESSGWFVESHHHILMDAWCMSLLLKDFLVCAQALLAGAEPAPPDSPPFRSYVEWLARQDVAEAKAFWRRELAGFRHATPLGFTSLSGADDLANDEVPERGCETPERDAQHLHASGLGARAVQARGRG
jgi:hypothetical protein